VKKALSGSGSAKALEYAAGRCYEAVRRLLKAHRDGSVQGSAFVVDHERYPFVGPKRIVAYRGTSAHIVRISSGLRDGKYGRIQRAWSMDGRGRRSGSALAREATEPGARLGVYRRIGCRRIRR
jgi:hypothetical protein